MFISILYFQGAAKKRQRKNSTASTQSTSTPSSTPAPVQQDLTPSGRKRRSDFGVPRKRKASDSTNDGDQSPQKKGDSDKGDKSSEGPEENMESADDSEKFKQQEESSDLKICRQVLVEY